MWAIPCSLGVFLPARKTIRCKDWAKMTELAVGVGARACIELYACRNPSNSVFAQSLGMSPSSFAGGSLVNVLAFVLRPVAFGYLLLLVVMIRPVPFGLFGLSLLCLGLVLAILLTISP